MPADLPARQDPSIAVIGMSCRLPGATGLDEFWSLLTGGRCSVSTIGRDRWAVDRFFHPRRGEPGRSYTMAAGLIDDPRGFDAAAFKISPREVDQMDPQQRLLLELVWEALEDAGLPPSTLAGQPVAVYVGASSVDNYTLFVGDPGSVDTHFMTGNALSIVANRISHAYDLHGPSLTIDTACSSSLVALNEAMKTLARGDADVAVVAGVNILAAPHAFYGFSRAGMLSPTGLCRPFAAGADGYVRAEGGAVLVLARPGAAAAAGRVPRAMIAAAGVNSDGRTVGLSLPSATAQLQLLEQVYGDAGIDPDALAFVEAHGTGTRVGDPAEAEAIGRALGQRRTAALPIGSVKSNIGHLEPASGLAGMVKAILALEHRLLPPTLHLDTLNPDIAFEELNLVPAREATVLQQGDGPLYAGVSSFGFGGTNAHAVLRQPRPDEIPAAQPQAQAPRAILLSAHGEEALRALAGRYADAIGQPGAEPDRIARHAAHGRDFLPHRLALPLEAETAARLRRFATGEALRHGAARSEATGRPVAFAFSGNGSQFAGMGRRAFQHSPQFRAAFTTVDAVFTPLAGWSLADALDADDLDQRLRATSTAQPLLFAVQVALAQALAAQGVVPSVVLGHSVGEVAAAFIAGTLSLDQAVRVIHWRSQCQEEARGLGGMAVLVEAPAEAERFCAEAGLDQLVVAAVNSPTCVTLSGPADQIDRLLAAAKRQRVVAQRVAVDYPFHSPLVAAVEAPLRRALPNLVPQDGAIAFVSAVTGDRLDGPALTVDYWWRNIREPVQFDAAARTALALGAGVVVEIGPKPVLTGHLREIAAAAGHDAAILAGLDTRDGSTDPVLEIALQALVQGAAIDHRALLGDRPSGERLSLPGYPWQHRGQRPDTTPEHIDLTLDQAAHPLLGTRLTADGSEWSGLLDPDLLPYLSGHRVAGEVVVPGAALLEMAVAAGRAWFGSDGIEVEDFDILQALVIPDGTTRETRLRLAPGSGAVEIFSRQRLAEKDWTLHARGRVAPCQLAPEAPAGDSAGQMVDAEAIYAAATAAGLDYGPAFRLASRVVAADDGTIMVDLAPEAADNGLYIIPHALHPTVLDAAFHGLFVLYGRLNGGRGGAYLPVRFASLRVHATRPVRQARLTLRRASARSVLFDITLCDAERRVVAELRGARFQHSALSAEAGGDLLYRTVPQPWGQAPDDAVTAAEVEAAIGAENEPETGDDWLLLTAFARSLAHQVVRTVAGTRPFTIDRLCQAGRLDPTAVPRFEGLVQLLAGFGLAEPAGQGWRLPRTRLPSAQAILRTILADYPSRGAEATMAARLARDLANSLRTGQPVRFSKGVEAQLRAASPAAAPLLQYAADLARRLASGRQGRPLALLLVDPDGHLLPAVRPLLRAGMVTIAVTGPDPKPLAALAARTTRQPGLAILDGDAAAPAGRFDLALAAGIEPPAAGTADGWGRIAALLRPGAPFAVLHAVPDAVLDLLCGDLQPQAGRLADALAQADLTCAGQHPVATPGAPARWTLWTSSAARPVAIIAPRALQIRLPGWGEAEPAWIADLAGHLHDAGHTAQLDGEAGDMVLLFLLEAARDPVRYLSGAMLAAREALAALPPGRPLWLVARSVKANGRTDSCRGLAAALGAFARVLANEYPAIPLRFVTIGPSAMDADAARHLARILGDAGDETEFEIGAHGVTVPRVEPARPVADEATGDWAARLDLAAPGGRARLAWGPVPRRAPAEGEIEIEVAASGLNFRDVMFSLGLLPDDYLEDGFAGPTLGFECAGTIRRIGQGVSGLQPGDRVMAFAPAAFASHVTVPAQVVLPMPAGIDPAAAATMPVAFLTAWYALVHQAGLQRGETVLVHGAAGGVGLAALQIARVRGARVVATAGHDDKRALAGLMGAELVLDSRSLTFADEIHDRLGGVDVVLNSLSGEAMRRSLRALKPFGRFIELGKRDFVANTTVGLRALAGNVSYFSVDADQLLSGRGPVSGRLLRDLGRLFAQRRLTPLPYRPFPAEAAEDAFRLMQGSGHIGKIVITPPADRPAPAAELPRFQAQETGFHLVVGGTGGFGFEAALWLADHGARTIVVASRRGTLCPADRGRAEALASRGIQLVAETLDVTDRPACERLLAALERRHGPLRGLIHAAMVLDDGLVRDLDASRIEAVLAPKITGAVNLDLVSRTRQPDYFVLFSSATTMIGNPGQASYVAANAFVEELARTRRARGLPALAVAWGAIADAGVLAREAAVGDKLKRRLGRSALPAAEALGQLGHLLARPASDGIEDAVVACARIDWQAAARGLPVLAAPRLSSLADGRRPDAAEADVDLATMVAGRTEAEALALVKETMLAEIGRILRMPPADVEADKPFAELGMDSLMGLELDAVMQKRYGIELPFLSIGAGLTLNELAGKILARLRGGADEAARDAAEGAENELMARHVAPGIDTEKVEMMREAVRNQARTTQRLLG